MKHILLVLISLCFFYLQSKAQTKPRLLYDLNTTGASSNPEDMVYLNGYTFFIADDGIHGRELWKTDGTLSGTVLVKDINPSLYHGFKEDPYDNNKDLIVMNGEIFMITDDGIHGFELWKSDGTEEGTVLVKDINPDRFESNISEWTVFNSELFFSAHDGSFVYELWKSDGTKEGTVMVEGVDAMNIGNENPKHLTEMNGVLFFSAKDQIDNSIKLWKYDGITSSIIYEIEVYHMLAIGTTLYFVGDDGIYGQEIWKTDGTSEGTLLIKDINPGFINDYPNYLTNFNEELYFRADDGTGYELWKSNGTEVGTTKVIDLTDDQSGGSPTNLVVSGNTLYFIGQENPYGTEVWKTDGTEAGTKIVKNINSSGGSGPDNLVDVGGNLYFSALADNGKFLWKTDGTEAGTISLTEIYLNEISDKLSNFINVNGQLFFAHHDGLNGVELWKSDGTIEGTVMIKDINKNGSGSNIQDLTISNNFIYFSANGEYSKELWKTDGINTNRVNRDVWVYNMGETSPIINLKNRIYISGGKQYNNELSVVSPVSGRSSFIKNIYYEGGGARVENLFNLNEILFFTAANENGRALWKSDGTQSIEGTVMVKDISTSTHAFTDFHSFTAIDNSLFFVANNDIHGLELWKSDGTETGTMMVKDIKSGGGFYSGSAPLYLVNFNGTLFFRADDGTGSELWKSDGTEAGTVKVIDLNNDYPGGNIQDIVVSGNSLYFSAFDSSNGRGLWKSDGTEAGTTMVKNIKYGIDYNKGPEKLYDANGTLYFVANDGNYGKELWKSDGTEAGTVMVKDINTSGDSSPEDFLYANGLLYFTADDGINGKELWVTDGNKSGTRLVSDIYPGVYSSAPANKILLNGQLIFSATTELGEELWVYDLPNYNPANEIPISEDHTVTVKEDQPYYFSVQNFKFIDEDEFDQLQAVKISANTDKGKLFVDTNMNGIAENSELISDHYEISTNNISKLCYLGVPNSWGEADANFKFMISDGKSFSDVAYQMTVNILPVADQPIVSSANTIYGEFNTSGLVINPSEVDGANEISHYKISNIKHGKLYDHTGAHEITEGQYIIASTAIQGLMFMPDTVGTIHFDVRAAIGASDELSSEDIAVATIEVEKASQEIILPEFINLTASSQIQLPEATAAGLPISYLSEGQAIASVYNYKLSFASGGEIKITASQEGNVYYKPAQGEATFTVAKLENNINFDLPASIIVGDTLKLSALASSGKMVEFTFNGTAVAALEGNMLIAIKEGHLSIIASEKGNGQYNPAKSVVRNLEVKAASVVTGTGNELTFTKLKAYPNPSQGEVNLELDFRLWKGAKLVIYNIIGTAVYQTVVNSQHQGIDLGKESPGMYFLTISLDNKKSTLKIIKQ